MPKLSDTMETGKILSWKKNEGDAVKYGDVIAEVETDKTNMEIEAYNDGFLRRIIVKAGDKAVVGGPIALITEKADEDADAAIAKLGGGGSASAKKEEPKKAEAPAPSPEKNGAEPAAKPAPATVASAPSHGASKPAGGRVMASPLALRMAAEAGLDVAALKGSGPEGRVIKRDIEAAMQSKTAAPAGKAAPVAASQASAAFEDAPVSTMRDVIARRLLESKNTIPHYYVTMDVAMDAAAAFRAQINELSDVKVSFNDIVLKACALALHKHPYVNSSWRGNAIRLFKQADIAVAVAIEDGLITPIVRNAGGKGLGAIAVETKALAEKARNKKLAPNEYTGGTFSISNLGMMGVDSFTAIINPPEAAILAVGAIRDEPVVRDGAVVPGKMMKITLSSDHRIVDGALAAQFLGTVKSILEQPARLAL